MQGLESLLVVTLVAALTPMIVAAIPGPGIPQVVILILLTLVPRIIGPARVRAVIRQGRRATSQTTLRWSIVLLPVPAGWWAPPALRASPAPRTRPTARTTTALPRLSSCQAWPCLFLLNG
jgi:hypothetical protein